MLEELPNATESNCTVLIGRRLSCNAFFILAWFERCVTIIFLVK